MSRFKKKLEKKFNNKISYEEFGELIKMVQKFNNTASRQCERRKKKEDASKGQKTAGSMIKDFVKSDQANTSYNINVQYGGVPEKVSNLLLQASCNTEFVDQTWTSFTSGFKKSMDKMKPVIVIKIRSENPEDSLEELKEQILEFKCWLRQCLLRLKMGPKSEMVDRVKLFFCT